MNPNTNATDATRLANLETALAAPDPKHAAAPAVFELRDVGVTYSGAPAVKGVSFDIPDTSVTALIGPSGCGKSTLLRCLNRMNDLVAGAEVQGSIRYRGADLYAREIDPVLVRRTIGMVFQKPNPFPKSIRDNIVFALKVAGLTDDIDARVEQALRSAALWDEVKDDLKRSALTLSGGQQQRLCIARTLACAPDAILMDEPCSALDPIATARIEDLIRELRERYAIIIVTHNMQQAIRISDRTAFFSVDATDDSYERCGKLIETGTTIDIFSEPSDQRTADYVAGRFG